MNYAIDRLDRRQRYASQNDTSSTPPSSSKNNNGSLASDLSTALHTLLRIKQSPTCCEELSKAHTLAGATLRDGGYVKQSVFHFGMSWIYSPNCPMRAADYAQMMDFAGYPEIGALSLLYFSCGGELLVSSVSESHHDKKIGDVMNIFMLTSDELKDDADCSDSNCGCGFSECGASNYFLPFDFIDNDKEENNNSTMNMIIHHLASLLNERPNASEKLISKQKDKNHQHQHQHSTSLFLQKRHECLKNHHSPSNSKTRDLPPVVKLLLLKLLYCNPIGGPFLCLSCDLVESLGSSSTQKKVDALYKSHRAYFIFIDKMIEGWKIKKHRRHTIPYYHVPIRHILSGIDQRVSFGGDHNCYKEDYHTKGNEGQKNKNNNGYYALRKKAFIDYMKTLLLKNCDDSMELKKQILHHPQTRIETFLDPFMIHHHDDVIKPLYILGDSHVISIAWQLIHIATRGYRIATPVLATGLKAWHTTDSSNFFTKYNLKTNISRILEKKNTTYPTKTILLSAGEIDCREGIGREKLQKDMNNLCADQVENTVHSYVDSVKQIAMEYQIQILLLSVTPHGYRKESNGKALGRATRRKRTELWNDLLRRKVKSIHHNNNIKSESDNDEEEEEKEKGNTCGIGKVFFLDYEEKLREECDSSPTGYVLNKHLDADHTHMHSGFLPHLEDALFECGCDLSMI